MLDDMANKPGQRCAYAYIRVSSAEQEKGDSSSRQTKPRNEVLVRQPGWILEETSLL